MIIPAVPAAPTGLTATLQLGPQVKLDFTDLATYETGFTIERAVNGGPFATLTTLPANSAGDPLVTGPVTYIDTTVTADTAVDTTYAYRVRADNGAIISSAWSNTASVIIPPIPAAPSGLTATPVIGARRPGGPARLHRQRYLRDRLHDRACRQRRALGAAHHLGGQPRDGPRYLRRPGRPARQHL